MKITLPSVISSAVCFSLFVIATTLSVVVMGRPQSPWCDVSLKRNWRLPPRNGPPPPPPSSPFFNWRPPPINLPGRTHLTLYQHENHNGLRYEQFVGQRCYNLPGVINDKASSLNTHGRCVMVCKAKDCKRCKKMDRGTPGHFKLSEIGMDDLISSVKPCGDVYE